MLSPRSWGARLKAHRLAACPPPLPAGRFLAQPREAWVHAACEGGPAAGRGLRSPRRQPLRVKWAAMLRRERWCQAQPFAHRAQRCRGLRGGVTGLPRKGQLTDKLRLWGERSGRHRFPGGCVHLCASYVYDGDLRECGGCPWGWGGEEGFHSSPRNSAFCSSAAEDTPWGFIFLIKAEQMIDMLHFSGSSLLYCPQVFSFLFGRR